MEEDEDDEKKSFSKTSVRMSRWSFECCREESRCRPSFQALGWSLVPDRYGTAGKFIPP
jgi:hypothetical protein